MRLLIFLCLLTTCLQAQTLQYKNTIVLAIYQLETSSGYDTINEFDRESKGYFQMRDSTVDDVNRILKKQKINRQFTYQDRFDYKQSVLMVFYWSEYYTPNWDYEKVSRKWGCGPAAIRLGKCKKYWQDIQVILKTF